MENAELVGLSRQVTLRRQMAVVANNLANMNTIGFKSENSVFQEYLSDTAKHNGFEKSDRPISFVIDDRTITDLSVGATIQTSNPTDMALEDGQFFSIQTADGVRYTRNGAFKLNAVGQLATSEGNLVLGRAGPIQFATGDTKITVSRDGIVSSNDGERGQLAIFQVNEEVSLLRSADNLFEGGDMRPAENPAVMQGYIEKSNVRGVLEVSRMIEIQRAYESIAKQIQRQDEIRRDAIKKLGKLEA